MTDGATPHSAEPTDDGAGNSGSLPVHVAAALPAEDRILALIERVALDPSADVGKLSQLMDLRERWRKEQAEDAFNAAKGRILEKLAGIRIVKRRSVSYKPSVEAFKYAPLEDIDKVTGPLLAAEQMDLSYTDEPMTDGRLLVRGRLKHLPMGYFEDSSMAGPVDTSGGKNAVQAIGSTNSYLRRYIVCNLFNIVVIGDDDDGAGGPMTEQQAAEIVALIRQAKAGQRFMKYLGWPLPSAEATLEAIVAVAPLKDYAKAKSALLEQIARKEK